MRSRTSEPNRCTKCFEFTSNTPWNLDQSATRFEYPGSTNHGILGWWISAISPLSYGVPIIPTYESLMIVVDPFNNSDLSVRGILKSMFSHNQWKMIFFVFLLARTKGRSGPLAFLLWLYATIVIWNCYEYSSAHKIRACWVQEFVPQREVSSLLDKTFGQLTQSIQSSFDLAELLKSEWPSVSSTSESHRGPLSIGISANCGIFHGQNYIFSVI